MLFGYPIAAAQNNNWLHECLVELLTSIHRDLKARKVAPNWPEIIPERFRDRIQSRTGLKERLLEYRTSLLTLNETDRDLVLRALIEQNQIAALLSMQGDCQTLSDLPCGIQRPVKALFEFAFLLLSSLGVRDAHYLAIYNSTADHVCPFCGCEYLDAPQMPREALDHYLPESEYAFAAANLFNLAPMCNKCNSRYKLARDPLRREGGKRRKAFNPYSHQGISVVLDNSQPFCGRDHKIPEWVIDFVPDSEEVSTWDDIFKVRERYIHNVLDDCFIGWLGDFANWYCSLGKSKVPSDISQLADCLERYFTYLDGQGFKDRVFLRAATFRMIQRRCLLGDQRLVRFLLGLLNQRLSLKNCTLNSRATGAVGSV